MIKAGTKKIIPYSERLMPTTTARASRLQLFQPTRTPTYCTRKIETPYGTGEVIGRLGQMHAQLLEAICFHAERVAHLDSKGVAILIDPHEIRKALSDAERYSWSGINALAADLRAAVLRVAVQGSGLAAIDGILDRLSPSPTMTRTNRLTGDMRRLFVAHLSPTYAAWLKADPVPMHYDPTPLTAIRFGASTALARWVLTHRETPNGGWLLDTVLNAAGAVTTGASGRKRRHEIRADSDALAGVGIRIEGDRVFGPYRQAPVLSTPGSVLSTPGKRGWRSPHAR